ncbi:endonuclease/exonuclease/phosphatase family protein [Alkalihalobacillus sp. TS-13]|uniref:endonuclease/exonuclease/phosphatase family protein n=1 Tax=Alkalihalobacillus sp. TS-13 TaxID=2842455 RepID=UPI001C86CDC0|nr:endonuclease/exonuclease/phosphatase family protein [Alkalihalobacillus sp. TS-13]
MELKIMTYNIRHGKGTDKKLDIHRIIKVLMDSDADIIGLNEVDKQFSKRSEFMDQAESIASALEMAYVFGPAITMKSGGEGECRRYGSAILTRFPILKSTNHPFDFLPGIVEDRALLEVLIEIESKTVAVYTTHLSLAPFLHGRQTDFIIDHVTKKNIPTIIMGDWNMKPFSSSWRSVTEQLNDTWFEQHGDKELGHTYPSKKPRMKLDYIFTNEFFQVKDAKVLKENKKASDHLPLCTTLKFNE